MNLCPICRVGRLQKRKMAYLEWHGKNLLVVDRMPVYICDVCGEQTYDHEAIENLHRLLWSNLPHMSSATVWGRYLS